MSNIYAPLDYSEIKSVLPPGEDIIYSTLAKYKFNFSLSDYYLPKGQTVPVTKR